MVVNLTDILVLKSFNFFASLISAVEGMRGGGGKERRKSQIIARLVSYTAVSGVFIFALMLNFQ